MNSLLPPNATVLERRIAQANACISGIPVEIGTLMDPDKIPLAFLPWLAWHVGVETWKDYWPEQVKRARVKTAIRIARVKGTAEAVRQVCASFGANVAMREWFETTPRGKPGTFEILLTVGSRDGVPATAEYVADIRAEVDRAKRGTAHYIFKQGYSANGTQRIGAGARPAVYHRLSLSDT
ncbi:phage tail protein I [Burkholderia ubonensis]|uniref:phage tail protein I n=1 Tax=Burkholderia ubonensis TaxID=101571 RepID=UPI000751E90C|nr:phage tail protein I [Burkholderia ubonensis]KVC61851.1 phage tail protein [Burkholderia ubonensis]KVC82461.1 phage tail protein [Burkholderia ubonensis]KVT38573.1 phage tail protein [Burkholderia ubonensis]